MMTEKMEKFRTVSIDADTDDKLDWLRKELDSPKAWILRRLVNAEVDKVKSGRKR